MTRGTVQEGPIICLYCIYRVSPGRSPLGKMVRGGV